LGGWGLAVSGIIVLANVAEVAAIYLQLFLGQDELAENAFVRVGLGVVFIALMTYISYRVPRPSSSVRQRAIPDARS
jgi:hypothetical protein